MSRVSGVSRRFRDNRKTWGLEKSFFKKPALCALRALLKARTDSVQLWEAGRFQEIIPALLLPFTPFMPPLGVFRERIGRLIELHWPLSDS